MSTNICLPQKVVLSLRNQSQVHKVQNVLVFMCLRQLSRFVVLNYDLKIYSRVFLSFIFFSSLLVYISLL